MAVAIGTRFRTGETCVESGVYGFDGYLDGAYPAHRAEEREIPVSRGEKSPPIWSSGRSCFWKLIRKA